MKRPAAVLVLSCGLAACQTLLWFGDSARDDTDAATDAATNDVASDASSDAAPARDAMPCSDPHVLLCADFEDGRDLSGHGFDATAASPGYVVESTDGGKRLRVDQRIAENQRFDLAIRPDAKTMTFVADLAAANSPEGGALDGNYVTILRFTAGAIEYALVFDPYNGHQFLFAANQTQPTLQQLESKVLKSPAPIDGSSIHVELTIENGDAGAIVTFKSPLRATYVDIPLQAVQTFDGLVVGNPQGLDAYLYYDNLVLRAD